MHTKKKKIQRKCYIVSLRSLFGDKWRLRWLQPSMNAIIPYCNFATYDSHGVKMKQRWIFFAVIYPKSKSIYAPDCDEDCASARTLQMMLSRQWLFSRLPNRFSFRFIFDWFLHLRALLLEFYSSCIFDIPKAHVKRDMYYTNYTTKKRKYVEAYWWAQRWRPKPSLTGSVETLWEWEGEKERVANKTA